MSSFSSFVLSIFIILQDTTPSPNLNVLYGLNSQESELDNRIDTICPNQMNDWNPLELSEWKQPIPPFNELSLPDDKCDIVKIEEFGAEYNFKVEPLKNNGKHFSVCATIHLVSSRSINKPYLFTVFSRVGETLHWP